MKTGSVRGAMHGGVDWTAAGWEDDMFGVRCVTERQWEEEGEVFIVKFSRQSKHLGKGTVKMETLPGLRCS